MEISDPQNTVLLFSHGFGVRKDNLGLFTFLSERFQNLGYRSFLFDYYEFAEATKEVFTIPFSKQSKILESQIKSVKSQAADRVIIIAQSQGSIIPTLADVSGVAKVIGISPFFLTDKDAVHAKYSAREGSVTSFNGISRRKHSDGTTTIIPPEYWTERFATNQEEQYASLATKTELTLICDKNEEVMRHLDLNKIVGAKIIKTNADHDFTGENRDLLYEILLAEIGS